MGVHGGGELLIPQTAGCGSLLRLCGATLWLKSNAWMCWRHSDAQERIISQPCQQVFILAACTRCLRRTLQKPSRKGKMMEFQLSRLFWANDALTVYNHAQSLISGADDGGPNQTESGLIESSVIRLHDHLFIIRVGLVMVPNPNTQTETTCLCQVKSSYNAYLTHALDVWVMFCYMSSSLIIQCICALLSRYRLKRGTWKCPVCLWML